MKAINLIRMFTLTILIVTAAALSSFATNPIVSNAPATAFSIQTTLSNSLKFPENVNKSDYEGTVDVIFLIEDGKMIVEKATSNNKELADYIKTELSKLSCKHIRTLTNQHYAVRLTFSLLDQ